MENYGIHKPDQTYKEHWISFRVHKDYVDEDALIKYYHKYNKPFMVLESSQDVKGYDGKSCVRDHYQGMVQKKSNRGATPKTIRDNVSRDIKKTLNLKGNKEFATTYIYESPEKFLRYLCKGSKDKLPNVIINNILLEEELRLTHLKYWEENKNYKELKGNKEYREIMAQVLPKKWQEKPEKVQITMKIIQYKKEKNLLIPDNYQLKKLTRTYYMRTMEDDLFYNYSYRIAKEVNEIFD